MNERQDPLESEIRASHAQELDILVHELDRRIAPHLEAQTARRSGSLLLGPRVWKPALALGTFILAVGLGFFLGSQRQNVPGPIAVQGASPTLVSQSEEHAAVALYEASKQLEGKLGLDGITATKSAEPEMVSESQASSEVESEAGAPSDADDAESMTTYSAIPAAPAMGEVPSLKYLAQDQFNEMLTSSNIASLGLVDQGLIFAEQNGVFQRTATGELKLLSQNLKNPSGVAVDVEGRVFVTERLAEGSLIALEQDGGKTTIRSGLDFPAGIAFAPDRSLYLAEQGRGRVLRFLPMDGRITTQSDVEVFATGFTGLLETADLKTNFQGGPFALTVTQENELLVSDVFEGKTVIYRFSLDEGRHWWERFWLQFP